MLFLTKILMIKFLFFYFRYFIHLTNGLANDFYLDFIHPTPKLCLYTSQSIMYVTSTTIWSTFFHFAKHK